MQLCTHHLLCSADGEDMGVENKSDHVEMARCMFWLMIVGYNLRTLENRFDMEQTMLLPPCS